MFAKLSESVTDLGTTAAIAVAGVIGVENVDIVTNEIARSAVNAGSASGSPDWIEPLFQGLIAILSILAAFFRNGKNKKDRSVK